MKALLLILLLTFISLGVHAQAKATAIVYRSKETSGSYPKTKTAIYINGVKVAMLGNNRIFTIELEPGTYMFRARDKKEPGIEFAVESGQIYYIRGDMDLTRVRLFRKPNFRLTLIDPLQAKAETTEMVLISKEDIKDPRIKQ